LRVGPRPNCPLEQLDDRSGSRPAYQELLMTGLLCGLQRRSKQARMSGSCRVLVIGLTTPDFPRYCRELPWILSIECKDVAGQALAMRARQFLPDFTAARGLRSAAGRLGLWRLWSPGVCLLRFVKKQMGR
jgi:hypothetical protein